MSKYHGRAGCPPLYEKKLQRCIFYITQPQAQYIESLVEDEQFTSASQFMRRLLEAVI